MFRRLPPTRILPLLAAALLWPSGDATARVETLRWQHPDPASVDSFEIYARRTGEGYGFPVYTGMPTPAAGIYSVDIEVEDGDDVFFVATASGDGGVSELSNEIRRDSAAPPPPPPPTNQPPVMSNPGRQSGMVGDSVSLSLFASDPDGDPLSWQASGLPSGLSIGAATGRITGTLQSATSNTAWVTVRVTDGTDMADAVFGWDVAAAPPPPPPPPSNDPPVVSNPGTQSSTEGDTVSLTIAASDPDGDSLRFTATGLPAGLSIGRNSGRISGTLASGSAGSASVRVTVSDGEDPVAVAFAWNVAAPPPPANRAPDVTNPGTLSSSEGDSVALTIAASDPDGDSLRFTATGLPAGLSIDRNSGRITGTVASGSAGTASVSVTVSDGEDPVAVAFAWNVAAPPAPEPEPEPEPGPRADPVQPDLAPVALPFRINAGGDTVYDFRAEGWMGDEVFVPDGRTTGRETSIEGTSRPELYTSRREAVGLERDWIAYEIPVDRNEVTIRFHYAEIDARRMSRGARVFDVEAEGQLVDDDLDVYRRVGARRALVRTATVLVEDGWLSIRLIGESHRPMVAAIEILDPEETPPPAPTAPPGAPSIVDEIDPES